MNTNVKEAIIQLLIIAKSHNEAGEDVSCSALIEKCIELLQDNEDTEVKEECCCIKAVNYTEICSNCQLKIRHNKPSSKVEKLKELRKTVEAVSSVWPSDFKKLLSILIEDEE